MFWVITAFSFIACFLFQLGQLFVGRVGLGLRPEHLIPVKPVKFLRVLFEKAAADDLLRGIVVFHMIESVGAAKIGDAAFGGDAGAAKKDDIAAFVHKLLQLLYLVHEPGLLSQEDLKNKPEEAHHFKIIIGFKGDGAVIQTLCARIKSVFGRQIVVFVAHFYGKMLRKSGNFPLERAGRGHASHRPGELLGLLRSQAAQRTAHTALTAVVTRQGWRSWESSHSCWSPER